MLQHHTNPTPSPTATSHRPHAHDVQIPFYGSYTETDPAVIAQQGVERFKKEGRCGPRPGPLRNLQTLRPAASCHVTLCHAAAARCPGLGLAQVEKHASLPCVLAFLPSTGGAFLPCCAALVQRPDHCGHVGTAQTGGGAV